MRRVTFWLGLLVVTLLCTSLIILQVEGRRNQEEDDDDFAEFDDDFDEDPSFRRKQGDKIKQDKHPPSQKDSIDDEEEVEESPKGRQSPSRDVEDEVSPPAKDIPLEDDDEVVVEDDDFDGVDDDEFEEDGEGNTRKRDLPPPKLTITSVPMPTRGWQAYWAELLMLSGIGVYLLNYVLGRYKNQRIAQVFFDYNWNILEDNFSLLGDSTKVDDDQAGTRNFIRMSDSLYQMWCSGRTCCEGMLLELKLLKRQDLVAIISNIFRPARDAFRFTVEMSKEEMDSVVFALANKKQAAKMSKEYNDLINYCPEKKGGDKFGLPSQFVIMSELPETVSAVLDSRATSVINKYAPHIESIHYSDQFTGTKSAEPEMTKDGVVKPPDAKRLLVFTFLLPTNSSGNNVEQAVEEIQPLFQFVFHTMDRFKRIRLSKEGKIKADKNRAKVEEAYMKQTHAARTEAAAARKEEKRRQEKERMLQEEDPEKQRRWEEKEQKREKKKKQPKMKQLKVKAM